MVGNENKQVDILTSFIFNNIIVDDGQVITAVNIEYIISKFLIFTHRASTLK